MGVIITLIKTLTMNKYLLILLIMIPFEFAMGQAEKAFPQYNWINANVISDDGSRFGYVHSSFTLINKDCRTLPKTDPCYEPDEYNEYTLLGRYKNDYMNEYANILYSPGMSADPQFAITDKDNNIIWSDMAEELCISSTGVIYTSGNLNRMFNQRMKFQFSNGEVREVEQPYYYVDVKGSLLKPVKLYNEKNNLGELIATLPVGYEIEVLLSEVETAVDEYGYTEHQYNYLARTAFGLVGWLHLSEDSRYFLDPIVKGLGFYGD